MFVPIERLFARQARSRAAELVALKRRLRAERATSERDEARQIRALKVRLAARRDREWLDAVAREL